MSYDDEHRDDEQPAAEVLSSSGGALIGAANVLPYPSEPSAPPARRRRGLLVAGAAAAVLAVGGGAWTVGSALSGGGAQPESVVPATAAFYVELDLDPSAGQKVDAYRFLKKFPQLRDLFAESGGLGPGFAKLFDGSDIDYAKDIEPWLGDRFAVALVPGAKKNDPLRLELVLQVTDEKAAESSLGTLVEGVGGLSLPGASVVVRDGYAIVAAEQSFGLGDAPGTDAAAQLSAEAETASLADDADYNAAVAPYGSGVMTLWSSNGGLSSLAGALPMGMLGGAAGLGSAPSDGYSVSVLRFDGDALELVGSSTGSQVSLPSGGVSALLDLPDSTLAAVGGAGLGQAMSDAVAPALEGLVGLGALAGEGNDPSQLFGPLGDPAGWGTLFGDQTVLAVGGGSGSEPAVGVRVVGGQDTVDAVLALVSDAKEDVSAEPTSDGVVVSDDAAWARALAAGGGFGDSQRFRDAVPEADQASVVGFADLEALVDRVGAEVKGDQGEALDALSSLGLSVSSNGDTLSYRIRLLTR